MEVGYKNKDADSFIERHLPDPYLIFAAVVLMIIGMVFIFSTSSVVGQAHYNDPYYFFKRHVVFLILGCAGFFFFYATGPNKARPYSVIAYVVSLLALAAVFVPGLGVKVGGSTRWLNLRVWAFQPSELLKLTIPLYMAHALSNKGENAKEFLSGILPILLFCAPAVLMVLKQPDLGTVIVIAAVMMAIVWVTGVHWGYMTGMIVGGLSAGTAQIATHRYQMQRITAFLDPWADPQGISFHLIQSWNAIGSGGLFGQGLGNSKIKFFYLPQQYTDFIFAVVCEEGGFITAVGIILLLMVLAARCFRVAILHQDPFKRYLATGLSVYIIGQSLVNIGVVVGLLPTTGIPLPMISFGGTSVLVTCLALGWLARLSTQV